MKKEENFVPNDEPLLKIEHKLDKVQEKFEENTLAMEMLKELKKSGTRKFIIIIILVLALIGTNVGWLIYESQFETITEEETTGQYMENLNNATNSTFTQTIN